MKYLLVLLMVPTVVDSVVLVPAAACQDLGTYLAATCFLLMKTSPEKDLPQGEALSQWEFKPSIQVVINMIPYFLFFYFPLQGMGGW